MQFFAYFAFGLTIIDTEGWLILNKLAKNIWLSLLHGTNGKFLYSVLYGF